MTSENNGMIMPVTPAYGGNGGGMFDGFGGGWGLLILLAILGWGNGGFGGFGGGNMMPWMNNGNEVQRGFDQSAIISGLTGIQNAVTSGFAQAETANNARQMADMQQMFGVQSALQNCCCQQSANTADLKYTVATEACADRAAIQNALRDVMEANNASTQKILDVMCQDRLDAAHNRIADLERQLTMANLAASQGAQTAAILANNEAQTAALERYLAPTPIPAYMVQNPNCCSGQYGCGCNS